MRCGRAPLLGVTFVLRLDIRDLGASEPVFRLVVFVSNGDTGVSGRVRDYFCHLCVNALGGRAMPDPKLDGALDTIHELTTRRDDTLAWLDLYIEQDPDRAQLYWFLIDALEGS